MLRVFSSLLRPTPLVCNKESLIARPVQNNCWNAQRWRVLIRGLRASATNRGLEEFFPRTDNPVEEGERSGRPWLARELRHKSNEDLHKLWYVLLKERNMLLTVKQEANRELYVMPGPERLRKVRRSMARIKVVLFEREGALRQAKQLIEQPETAKSAITQKPRRKVPHKLGKMLLKRSLRVGRLRRYQSEQSNTSPPVKKRKNVRNYKHIKAVRELEQKEHL